MSPKAPGELRPGGRSARVRAAVHRAVEELLAESTVEALTIPVIADRAGVHSTTVYRRWGSVGELLAAVAINRFSGDLVVPDTGTLRGDLEQWATDVATDLADPDVSALMRATVGASKNGPADVCVVDRRAQLAAMLARETERGGHPPTVEQVEDFVLGPLYYRATYTAQPGDPAWARTLVTHVL
ncbi:TetR/AcrR family transcriptional regulator [Amycolatopsis sp. CA-230715]|uniref:TetR/AcrR family transcriptional regulator n=1 Tax=Amycolatopsis sp. CA-230715 TaxID=2745196 RepID=UPI001C32D000|nr:TetR/AcrR family transcriptional regulator [Amycolatopsis sp. CA-230715]QWF80285.1 hypothetical protein HUW46_03704 [Amycolatopsis sp. CA-230715]